MGTVLKCPSVWHLTSRFFCIFIHTKWKLPQEVVMQITELWFPVFQLNSFTNFSSAKPFLFVTFLLTDLLLAVSLLCKSQVSYLPVHGPYQLLLYSSTSVFSVAVTPVPYIPSFLKIISFLILSKEPPVSWGNRVAVLLQSSILLCCPDLFICSFVHFTIWNSPAHCGPVHLFRPLCDAGLLFVQSGEYFLLYAGKIFSDEQNLT